MTATQPVDRRRTTSKANGRHPPTAREDGTRTFVGGRTRRTRVPELAIGVVVTIAFALAAVLWQLSQTERSPAVVVAATVSRGDTIDTSDLRVAYVSETDGVRLLDPSQSDQIVGRTALVDLRPGTVMTTDLVAEQARLDDGTALVGVALEAGQYPTSGLAPGDRVNVVVSPGDGADPDDPTVLVERSEVFEIETMDDGRLLVSLKAPEEEANAVAAIGGSERIRLVQVPQ